jgi:uncharacterized RDD family membrane protein YckC
VELEDRITVATPEGIELTLALAGAGSRYIAAVIDLALQLVLIVLAALAAFALVGGGVGDALFAMAVFAALYLYNILFEVLAAGRTPGKRLTHLRVVRAQGAPVDLPASAIRNLVRLIDLLPGAYLVGLLSILLTERNQRLGDLAAGTLVIRETGVRRRTGWRRRRARRRSSSADTTLPSRPDTTVASAAASGWDVSAVSADELGAVRRFLERRESLDEEARVQLARRLERGLRAKVAGAPAELGAETFLEELARVKATR